MRERREERGRDGKRSFYTEVKNGGVGRCSGPRRFAKDPWGGCKEAITLRFIVRSMQHKGCRCLCAGGWRTDSRPRSLLLFLLVHPQEKDEAKQKRQGKRGAGQCRHSGTANNEERLVDWIGRR